MDEVRALILAMTDQAIHDWLDGTEEPTFPMTTKDCPTAANLIFNTAANAMAYGFCKGLEAQCNMQRGTAE